MGNYRIRHPKPSFRKFKAMLLVASPEHKMWRMRNHMIEIEIPRGDAEPVKYAMKKLFDYNFKFFPITRDKKRLGCSMRKLDMTKKEFRLLPPLPQSGMRRRPPRNGWTGRWQPLTPGPPLPQAMPKVDPKIMTHSLMYGSGWKHNQVWLDECAEFDAKYLADVQASLNSHLNKAMGKIIDSIIIHGNAAVPRPDGGHDVYLPSGAPQLAQDGFWNQAWSKIQGKP